MDNVNLSIDNKILHDIDLGMGNNARWLPIAARWLPIAVRHCAAGDGGIEFSVHGAHFSKYRAMWK